MELQQFLQIRILKSRSRMERKQKPHLNSCSSVLHLYFSIAWPLERRLVFSGFSPCCHWAHLNENCSCVSGIILVAAQSCGFFWRLWRWGLKEGFAAGLDHLKDLLWPKTLYDALTAPDSTSDAIEKLPGMPAIWSGLLAKQLELFGGFLLLFLAYVPQIAS